jgi:ribosomal protein S18 acetylase RimI-like enzyme
MMDLSNITIRRMGEPDLEVVTRIEKEVFSDPWSMSAFRTDLGNEMALPMVAEFEDKIVGYSNIYIVAGEVQIGNFAVAPGFRKRGVGRNAILYCSKFENRIPPPWSCTSPTVLPPPENARDIMPTPAKMHC